jgi:hypothetical protein
VRVCVGAWVRVCDHRCGETAIKAALGLCISAFKGVRNALVGKKSSKSRTKSRTQ